MNIMKIVLKLKPDELRALVMAFERTLKNEGEIGNRMDAIIEVMMLKFYKKLKEKSILMDKPTRLSVPVEYAIAFCEYWEQIPFDTTEFVGHVLLKTLNHFNQQTARFYYY